MRAVLGVPDAHTGDPVRLPQESDHLRRGPDDRAVVRGGAGHGHGVAGVVDDGVVVADPADQRVALEAGRHPQRTRAGQMLLRRNRFRAAHRVVEEDARRHVGAFPHRGGSAGTGTASGLTRCGARVRQRQFTFAQRLADQAELELLEVAQAAVEHLRRATRRPGRVVARLDQRHPQSAGGGVERRAGPDDSAADHDDVELFGPSRSQASALCGPSSSAPDAASRMLLCVIDELQHQAGPYSTRSLAAERVVCTLRDTSRASLTIDVQF